MEEFITLTIKEENFNTVCEVECSEMYNKMIKNGHPEYICDLLNQAILNISKE